MKRQMLAVLVLVGACDSELIKGFKDHQNAMCGCADADCAKAEHKKFLASWKDMKSQKIDWNSEQGKKDTKGIEAAAKEYRACLDKHVPAADATATCQDDAEAKKNTENCTACCEAQGRFFNSWVDPMAAGIAGALGAGNIKGCTCN